MNDQVYHDYTTFLRDRYGGRIYRIALDIGASCPNRCGPLDRRCIYCSDGSRAGYVRPGMTLSSQIESGIASARKRYDPDGFLAYFQPFSSTFVSTDHLRKCCEEALSACHFHGLVISTRPDCLSIETLDLLDEFSQKTDLWVEMGIQSVHDRTLLDVRRGHDFACSRRAVEELSERGIQTVAHVILGLPGENASHFSRTADVLAELPLSGIKIHNLHVVENTPLAESWKQGNVSTMDEREYAEALVDFLRRIPAHWPVMRLVSDTPYRDLLAPRWSLSKGEFVKYFTRRMVDHGWRQGDLLEDSDPRDEEGAEGGRISVLEGGSRGKIAFDSRGGIEIARGLMEACGFHRKWDMSALPPASRVSRGQASEGGLSSLDPDEETAAEGEASVLIIGFGEIPAVFEQLRSLSLPGDFSLSITGLMKDPGILPETPWHVPGANSFCEALMRDGRSEWENGRLQLFCGDPRYSITRFEGPVDAIILEPLRVELHPEIFTVDYLRCLRDRLAPSGIIAAASSSACVRGALQRTGLKVGMCHPERIPRGGTAAAKNRDVILHQLDRKDVEIMTSTVSGVPFRDHGLIGSRKRILAHRRDVIARLERRGWPERVL